MSDIIPSAGNQMTKAIKDSLGLETSNAEDLKIKFGFKECKENELAYKEFALIAIKKDISLLSDNNISKESKSRIFNNHRLYFENN